MDIKKTVAGMIRNYVREYQKRPDITSRWDGPLVGFADAGHPDILKLKDIVSPQHVMPQEVIAKPTVIIAYFAPFTRALADTNKAPGEVASPEWARTYEETNRMFAALNNYLIAELKKIGCIAGVPAEAATFDRKKLTSSWSQRHLARIAGLGTFGINNMLITEKGCCGRYGTVVTNLDVVPDKPLVQDNCLYKSKGICGICVKRCPSGALTLAGYDRKKCFQVCLKNAGRYKAFGSSYQHEDDKSGTGMGSEVCGKCVVNVPCSFK